MTNERPAEKRSLPFPLQQGEQVLDVRRRHWLYLWPNIALSVFLALAPVVAVALLLSALDVFSGALARVFWLVAGVYLLIWAVRIFLAWYRYENDIWVITNQRVIDSYKRHPLSLRIATADLVNIQDMTVERDGLLRTMFDYGDILCQTAAEQQEFRLAGIPDPRGVQALVDRERDREASAPASLSPPLIGRRSGGCLKLLREISPTTWSQIFGLAPKAGPVL